MTARCHTIMWLFIACIIGAICSLSSSADPPTITRLRVLTQNVQLTPIVGGTIDQQIVRAGKLVDAVLRANPPYDVIGFQEVFMEQPMQVLINGLKSTYPSILTAVPDGKKLFGSGLFLASRFPIQRWTFHKYSKSSGFDALEDKGLLISEFNVTVSGAVANLIVALTHQQSGGSYQIMTSQLQEGGDSLNNFLKAADASMQGYTTVIYMGDMNIDEFSQHDLYVEMKDRIAKDVTDVFRALHPDQEGLTWPLKPFPTERLDYIFGVSRTVNNSCNFETGSTFLNATVDPMVYNESLSDHFGLSSEIEIRLNVDGGSSNPRECVPESLLPTISAAKSNFSIITIIVLVFLSLIN